MCKRDPLDLARDYLRDMERAGNPGDPQCTELWCAAHDCTEDELNDALNMEDDLGELRALSRAYEDEEYGKAVNEEATLHHYEGAEP